MEISNNLILEVAKQRAYELENEIINYKAVCMQLNQEVKTLNEEIKKLKEVKESDK